MSNPTKIVSTPYPEYMEIGIEELKVTYIQKPDTNDVSEHNQRITLSTEMVSVGDMPYYVNVSIPDFEDGTPGHWSIDLTEDLTPILEDFKKRLETTKNKQEQ